MCIKILHPIYMCFICDQDTQHMCLNDINQLMKKQISHDNYCQIVAGEVCDVVSYTFVV